MGFWSVLAVFWVFIWLNSVLRFLVQPHHTKHPPTNSVFVIFHYLKDPSWKVTLKSKLGTTASENMTAVFQNWAGTLECLYSNCITGLWSLELSISKVYIFRSSYSRLRRPIAYIICIKVDLAFPSMDLMDNTQRCAVFFMLLPVEYPNITVPPQSSGYRLPHVMCATLCDYKVTPTNISDHEF